MLSWRPRRPRGPPKAKQSPSPGPRGGGELEQASRDAKPRREPALAYLTAAFLAKTAVLARAAVVIAVPSDIASTAKIPAEKIPCAKAKTRTKIAPEQGRAPAASIVSRALFQENPAPSVTRIGGVEMSRSRGRGHGPPCNHPREIAWRPPPPRRQHTSGCRTPSGKKRSALHCRPERAPRTAIPA